MKQRQGFVAAVYVLLVVSVLAVMAAQFLNGNFENVFLCLLTLLLFLLPNLLERQLRIRLPDTLEIVILLFIYAAEILGEISAFYTTFQGMDTILHALNGFLCAAIGFCLVDMFNRAERCSLRLSPAFVAVVAFCFSMTIGVLWEFFEFAMDQLFWVDMQKDTVLHSLSTLTLPGDGPGRSRVIRNISDVILISGGEEIPLGVGGYLDLGLVDTMKDLAVNFVGAVVFSVLGYFYVRGRGRLAGRFIPHVLREGSI